MCRVQLVAQAGLHCLPHVGRLRAVAEDHHHTVHLVHERVGQRRQLAQPRQATKPALGVAVTTSKSDSGSARFSPKRSPRLAST